jgi:hypothetical protein
MHACIQATTAYSSLRQHTSAYVSIRQHTSAYELDCTHECMNVISYEGGAQNLSKARSQIMPYADVSGRIVS